MHKFIRNTAMAGLSVITLAMMGGAPAMAAHAAPAAPVHAASVVQPSDTSDGYPDETVGEVYPDIAAQPMCKASGNHYCARITNNDGTPGTGIFAGNEISGPAEDLKFIHDAGSFTFRTHGYNAGHLYFTGHPNICVQAVNASGIQTGRCDGTGVVVGHGTSNGHHVWILRADTQNLNDLRVLGVLDPFGSFFKEVSWFDTTYFKRFDWG